MWNFALIMLVAATLPACEGMCSAEQLDVSKVQRALNKCRKALNSERAPIRGVATSTSPQQEITTVLPVTFTTTVSSTSSQAPASSSTRVPATSFLRRLVPPPPVVLVPPAAVPSPWRARTPRSFSTDLRNDASPHDDTLTLERESWTDGSHDKKCVFFCAFQELGLMDEEGRLVAGQLRRLLEDAARSPELRVRAAELVELCQYKMLHVSTIDATHLECDFPLMLSRCVLGRLSKHCEDHKNKEKQTLVMHPDVELLAVK